jgi:uncharacterized membrane protein YeiH
MRSGPEWFIWIETLGILSFAINAMIVAHGKNLSALGIFTCAFATALGGGTLRDLLLGPGAQPFFWIAFPFYIVAIFAMAVAYANLGFVRSLIARRDFLIKEGAELLALASLGALGAAKAFNMLTPTMAPTALGAAQLLILCAFLGAVSAAFGSILRDVLLNEFPGALKPGVWTLEALFIGSAALALARLAGVPAAWALLAGFLVVIVIRAPIIISRRPKAA